MNDIASASSATPLRIVGIDSVAYTVEDVAFGLRLFTDWGLELVQQTAGRASLRTQQGSSVKLIAATDEEKTSSSAKIPGFRGVTWGLKSAEDLEIVGARLE